MATDGEILEKWEGISKVGKQSDSIIQLYRMAEKDAVAAMEKEMQSEATIEEAIRTFGWGRKSRASIITVKALMNEAMHIAKGKAGK